MGLLVYSIIFILALISLGFKEYRGFGIFVIVLLILNIIVHIIAHFIDMDADKLGELIFMGFILFIFGIWGITYLKDKICNKSKKKEGES